MPLFLSVRNSFIPFFLFKAISSLSFEFSSTRAVTRPGVRTSENLLSLSSESETRTTSSFGFSPFSSKQNWSISALSDRREEALSSLGTATLWGERWKGSSIGRRSSQARKLGIETSIRASRGLPTLIAWPTSQNLSDKDSKSRMSWTTRNCLSSLTNTSNLNTLLRLAMLTRLRLGVTCLLSAKTFEKQNHGQDSEAIHQK